MALWTRDRAPKLPPHKKVTIDELARDYVFLDENVVTLKEDKKPIKLDLERGGGADIGVRRSTMQDYLLDLSGNRGIDKYREMRNDAVVRGALRVAKTPIMSARWFMKPASQEPLDVEISNFVWAQLNRLSTSFPQFLTETLFMLDYGVSVFEKVFEETEYEGKQYIGWKKFAGRHPTEIVGFNYDKKGGPESVTLRTDEDEVDLEIDKALIFAFDMEGGDLWGHSMLRSAYKHWFYKEQFYKIDAVQKERHGIGIPIIQLPLGFTPADKTEARRIGQNLRTNESAYVTLPPKWELMFLKLEGQKIDALESAQHHADKIYENVLATFQGRGNRGAGQDSAQQGELFVRAARFVAEIIRDTINNYAIPQLVDYNWETDRYPELKVRRLGDERDWRIISFAVRNFIGANALRVDEPLRKWVREELDLPPEDPATVEEIEDAPQGNSGVSKSSRDLPRVEDKAPPKIGTSNAGLPNQSKAKDMKKTDGGTGKGDGSGKSGA